GRVAARSPGIDPDPAWRPPRRLGDPEPAPGTVTRAWRWGQPGTRCREPRTRPGRSRRVGRPAGGRGASSVEQRALPGRLRAEPAPGLRLRIRFEVADLDPQHAVQQAHPVAQPGRPADERVAVDAIDEGALHGDEVAIEEAARRDGAEALHAREDAKAAARFETTLEMVGHGANLGLGQPAVDLEADDGGIVRVDDRERGPVRVGLLADAPAEGALALVGREHLVRDVGEQGALEAGRHAHPALV